MIQRVILIIVIIMILFNNSGCQTTRSWSYYNGMTREEIRNLWGEPPKIYKNENFKYGANEVWIYSGEDPRKTGGKKVFYFYFSNGIVVNREAKWWEAL